MNTSPIAIAQAEQGKATYPQASVWVSASAGSGKTKVLTDRVLALLLAGAAPERILCLTFTKAAAAEMSNRITERLARWVGRDDDALIEEIAGLLRVDPDPSLINTARQLFARVLDAPGGLRILTIHAFCQSVLRRFPLEADIAPHFTVMDERDSAEALAAAQEATIAAAQGADTVLAEALGVLTMRNETSFGEVMTNLVANRGKLRRALERHGSVEGLIAAIRRMLRLAPGVTEATIVAAACAEGAFDGAKLQRAATALAGGSATDQGQASTLGAWLISDDRVNGFFDYCQAFLTKNEPRKFRSKALQQADKTDPGLFDAMLREAERLAQVIGQLKAMRVLANTEALVHFGAHLLTRYGADKAFRGLMDYDDLIDRARRLLEKPGNAAWVLYKLDGGIDHVLIDEAQDTNPDQWAIVTALTAEFFSGEGRHEDRSAAARTVFAVGDPKQSIYSFQGADPAQFEIVQKLLRERAEGIRQQWRSIVLNVSFRSTPAVLHAVDTVFSQPHAREGLGEDLIVHLPARLGHGGLVEIWPPVEPAPRDEPPSWQPPVERTEGDSPPHRLAGLIARRIAHMIATREILESQGRPVRPGDIMVLVRRRTGFVRELVRQLKALGVAVAGVDRMRLTEQLAVMDLMALGQFLLLPEDDLTLATVLKGPLVGLSEDELFALAHDRGTRRLWEALAHHAGADSPFGMAHAFLEGLRAKTDYLPPADLYGHVLVALEGRKKIIARLGVEAEDPLDEFLSLALAYQRSHPPSLQGFLHWLAAGEIEIKRDLDQSGTDAVRVITAHGAKGLQAPIVFLPDTCQMPTVLDKVLWTPGDDPLPLWAPTVDDQDPATRHLRDLAKAAQIQEYRRLLYVALTRAEDRLYVCGWHTRNKRPEGSWYNLIKEGLSASPRLRPVEDAFFAKDTLFSAPEILRMTSPQSAEVAETLSPAALPAATPLKAWALVPPRDEPIPPQPLAPSTAGRADPPAASPLRDDGLRRFQRGIIIHRLLQSLPEIAPERRRAAAQALAGRPAWGLDEAARADVVRETLAVIEDPRFAAVFAAGSKAEVPLTGMVAGHVISAQVDRLAVTDSDVIIVDYKTNRPPARRSEDVDPAYVLQMAVYRAALAQIYPTRTVRCVLLWTDGPFILELAPTQLENALAFLP